MSRLPMQRASARLLVVLLCLSATIPIGWTASFVNFTVPGSIQTIPADINWDATVTGYYIGSTGSDTHGFVRSFAGAFATFDAPGGTNTTSPVAINSKGDVTGVFFDRNSAFHSFVRAATGTITAFDAPGALNIAFGGTAATAINRSGAIVGSYLGTDNLNHGFLRNPDGTFVVLDIPGALIVGPTAINDAGTVTGSYNDGVFNHGFVWTEQQSFVLFDEPGSDETFPAAINRSGTVAGSFSQKGQKLGGGFLRASDGTITTFSLPAGTVTVHGINENGEVSGTAETLGTSEFFGFVRGSSGTVVRFLVPGSVHTLAGPLNSNGVVCGSAAVNGSLLSGFLLIP